MSSTFEIKKGGAAVSVGPRSAWLSTTNILVDGFPTLESDTGLRKYGNGTETYSGLDYHGGNGYCSQFSINAASSISISLLPELHNYRFVFEDFTVSVNNSDLNLTVSTDDGTTWINSGYQWILKDTVSSTTVSRNTSASTFTIKTDLSNTSGHIFSGVLNVQNSSRLTYQSSFTSIVSSGDLQLTEGTGIIVGPINKVQLAISSGTFTGTLKLFRYV